MGSSSSSSSSSSTITESTFDNTGRKALSDAEKEKFVESIQKSLDKQNEEIQRITANMKAARKDGNISQESWFEAMTTLVQTTQATNTELLTQMRRPIQESKTAFTHFRNLVNSSALTKHEERVKGAMTVYHNYWELLTETSRKLTKIMVQVDRVIESIEDYETNKKLCNNDIVGISPDSVKACVQSLNVWLVEAQGIKELAEGWHELGKKAEEEQTEWKKIEKKSKKKCRNIAIGIGCVAAIAVIGGALCLVGGPCSLIAVGAAAYAILEIGTFTALGLVGFSVCSVGAFEARDAYIEYQEAKKAERTAKKVSQKIGYITSTMSQIAANAREIGKILDELNEIYISMQSIADSMRQNEKEMETQKDDNRKIVLMTRIDTSLTKKIKPPMIEFNKKCEECCQTIRQSKQDIVTKYKEFNQ